MNTLSPVPIWQLIGRADPLHLIAQALESDTVGGVLISGPAGVGRSRLAHHAGEAAATLGWSMHTLAATAAGRSVPMSAFAHWTPQPADAAALSAYAGVEMIAMATPPALLIIDDAHLLDEMSAFTVHQVLQRRLAHVVITVRAGASTPDTILQLWKDGVLRRIDLAPLSREDHDELLDAALGGPVDAGTTDQLYDLSRGNLAYLRCIVDHELTRDNLCSDGRRRRLRTEPELSSALRDLVRVHVGPQSPAVWEVVQLVAVTTSVDRRLLGMLADPDAVAEAEQRGLVETITKRL